MSSKKSVSRLILYELEKHDISELVHMRKLLHTHTLVSIVLIIWVFAVLFFLALIWFAKEPSQQELTYNPLEACITEAEESRASRWRQECKPMNEKLTRQIAKCKDPGGRQQLTGKECMASTCRNAGGLFGVDQDIAQTIDELYEEDRNACLKRYPMDAGHEF